MKNMRKLIPALCMLLVSAMLLGTSTFAWFTMNTNVTATGMQVKAQATGGLLIATYDGTKSGDARYGEGFKATATALNTSVSTISPVSTSNLTSWYSAIAESVDAYSKKSTDKYTSVTSLDSYRLLNHFAIKTADGSVDSDNLLAITTIKAENVLAGGSSETQTTRNQLNKAIRIAVVITDASDATNTATLFFAPMYDSVAGDKSYSWKAASSDSGTDTVNGYANLLSNDYVPAFSSEIPALSYLDIYVYYEGEDSNCKSSNTIDGVDTLKIEVGLNAIEKPVTSVTIAQATASSTIAATVANGGKTLTSSTFEWFVDGQKVSGQSGASLNWDDSYAGKKIYCKVANVYDSKTENIFSNTITGLK